MHFKFKIYRMPKRAQNIPPFGLDSEELAQRAATALKRLCHCRMCPRQCGVDRSAGQKGRCNTGRFAAVAAHQLHFGEEAPLVGQSGSGTIFIASCNLTCVFCQNQDISHPLQPDSWPEAGPRQLADMMLDLQAQGAANINIVSPSHVAAQLLEALPLAREDGLRLPLVWNSGGYDSLETLKLLDGVVDIYMPDVKFWDAGIAGRLCGAADYPQRARAAVAEMHRQVGELQLNADGLAMRGLLVRHLVLPGGLAGTKDWMDFLAGLTPRTYVNVMGQYHPCWRAGQTPEYSQLGRAVTPAEVEQAKAMARAAGLTRLDDGGAGVLRMLEKLLGG